MNGPPRTVVVEIDKAVRKRAERLLGERGPAARAELRKAVAFLKSAP